MNSTIRNSILAFALGLTVQTNAISIPKCPTNNLPVDQQAAQIHKIVMLGSDGRTIHQPRRLPARYAATGLLKCDGFEATAQLTGANDVITTASHVMINQTSCVPAKSCTFTPLAVGSRPFEVAMDTLIGECIRVPGSNPPKFQTKKDWAVAKLKRPVEGVEFYGVPKNPVPAFGKIRNTLVMLTDRQKDRLFTTQECDLSDPWSYKTVPMLHNCDTEPMGSGGAHINNQNELLAIHSGGYEAKSMEGKDFKADSNWNASVTLEGEFYDAVVRLTRPAAASLGQ